ncbi:SgcJ/EcaC family oxidoreductase [Micromonospora sp. WMMD1082]|uniref:SgcJ/EcaC family oxidoreductase n=1 Tax=Micromonospora sp. WMMD1082 TaxID=3016104 RepID=UPI0024175474|nr:SgcJ/EcaC family oxidoreductase [Micromonospora sp. WMMD1082]MDG4792784.1 SgcJ/EcaC family oxidoreductase [Micromonospora sp. WMMD1082]
MSPSSTSAVAQPTAEDQAAVAAISQQIVAAWQRHDADAFANVFTPDGTMILPGIFLRGRDEIRDFMATGFAGPYQGTQVTGQPFQVTFFSADTALVLTKGGVLAPGEDTVSEEREIRASWLLTKRDGRWLLAAYQNTPAH